MLFRSRGCAPPCGDLPPSQRARTGTGVSPRGGPGWGGGTVVSLVYAAAEAVTLCEIDGKTVETVSDFIFWGSKVTAGGDCSHEMKRRLLLGRKVMTNLDSILKSRDITLATKICLVKAMVFPVVMYGYESWTIKKAER